MTSSVSLNTSVTDLCYLKRHALCAHLPSTEQQTCGPTTLLMTTNVQPVCPITLVVGARSPSSFGQDEGSGQDTICSLNQTHTLERRVTMGDHVLDHHGLKSAEINPMAPLKNRSDELADGLAHRWIEAKRTSCVGWGPRLAATKNSRVLGRNSAFALQPMKSCKRRSFESVSSPDKLATKS